MNDDLLKSLKLFESTNLKFAGEQKPGDQWHGTDNNPPGNKVVGCSKGTTLEDVLSKKYQDLKDIHATEKLSKDVAEVSDPSGMMHAARHYNKSFIITAKLAEGGTKKYRIHAQSERVAREKFSQHYNMAKILTVEEEGVAEGNDGYDDESTRDEYMNLQSGNYVRDTQDSSGEVFIMRGQPDDRRVRIEDKDGRGWNIAPYRLVAVDPDDAAIGHYFNSMAEAKADPLGAWIAHKNGTEARKFKTREGAKKYVASHAGFTVSSSEAFHDTYRKKKVQEVKKFRTTYGWAGGSKEPRSAHAKQVAAKRKEYDDKGLGKFEPTDDMVGTAKIVRDIAMSNASPEHKKAAIDALNKKGVAEDSLNEFDPGEHGIPPFTVYVGDTLIDKFASYDEAQEEVEYQRGLDPRWFHDQWKIVNGIGETVWEYDVGEKSDDMRRQHKIQFIPRDNKDVAEGGKTPKQYWNRDSQSIGSTPDDGLTYADPDDDGVRYPDYANTKFQPQAKPTQATSVNNRLTDKQYAKQLHKHYASLYDTLRITVNRRKNIFSVTGNNGFETDYHKYRVDPTTNKLKIMMSTSVENESVNPGVVEGKSDYKIKSIGTDSKGDYYISPSTGKKVYKKAKVGDHENPKTGKHMKVEGHFSDQDVQKKDKQYAGTKAYHANKKAEKEKTATDAKTAFDAKFGGSNPVGALKIREQGVAEGGMPSSVIKSKQRYGDMSDKDFAELHQSKADDDLVAMAWRHGYGKGSLHYVNKRKRGKEGVAEGSTPLSVQQLATISDEALDKAYGYGRSTPGNTFGWQANLKSAAYAKHMIDKGVTDIEAISDAVHKGWWSVAQKFVDNPDQFSDTETLRAKGKFDTKMANRIAQMVPFNQLTKDQQDIDTVVAEALLKAITGGGEQGVAEDEMADFIAGGGKITQVPFKKPRKGERLGGSRHIGGGGDTPTSRHKGISANTQGNKVIGQTKRVAEVTDPEILAKLKTLRSIIDDPKSDPQSKQRAQIQFVKLRHSIADESVQVNEFGADGSSGAVGNFATQKSISAGMALDSKPTGANTSPTTNSVTSAPGTPKPSTVNTAGKAIVDPKELQALERLKANAGLKTQYDKLLQQVTGIM